MTNTKYHDKTWNVEQQTINQLMSIETHRHLLINETYQNMGRNKQNNAIKCITID